MFEVTVPTFVMFSKNKRYPFNLNHYRNAHFRDNNKGKELFFKMVQPELLTLPRFSSVMLFYTVFPARTSDTANIASIVDKFFCDALVETGRLEDDNLKIVKAVSFLSGEVDSKNPRVEIKIIPLCETQPMKITIHQDEIEQAIRDYINQQVNVRAGQNIEIDLTATRGSQGFTAEISISKNLGLSAPKQHHIFQSEDAPVEVDEVEESSEPEPETAPETFKSSALEDLDDSTEVAKPSLFAGLGRNK